MAYSTNQEVLLDQISVNTGNNYAPFGAFFISDTDAHTASGGWYAITMIEDTVFNALTANNWAGDTHTGETFPKGLTIYGNFTAIVLTSGACIAYFGTSDNTVTTT